MSNMKQLGLAARQYIDDNDGQMFHHHEGWVLDDGKQLDQLPSSADGCSGGGSGNSAAEKPWIIFFQPYMKSRQIGFCPSDPAARSQKLASNIVDYNGGIESGDPVAGSEQALAEAGNLAMESYLLNSVWTHKSCRFAKEGTLNGFATDAALSQLPNSNLIMFSERNSEMLSNPDAARYAPNQDDYDTWSGEAELVGDDAEHKEGWIRWNRHFDGGNYLFADGHAKWLRWSAARTLQYPDGVVRFPLASPPQ